MTTDETFYLEDLDENTVIADGAFDSSIGKEVPLKAGRDGPVIGTATVVDVRHHEDGTVEAISGNVFATF